MRLRKEMPELYELAPLAIVIILLGASILYSILSRRRAVKRYLYYSTFDPILANLGFLFQLLGFLLTPAVAYAYYLQEYTGGVAISLSCAILLFLGLLLTLFFEPKMLDLKQSCVLLVLYYISVTFIISLQFLQLGVFEGSFSERFLSSLFEAASAISTTGFTLLKGHILPRSIILARAIAEWNGGVGIIFLLLSSFYPGLSLSSYGKALGIERIGGDYKISFAVVLLIYTFYTIVFSVLLLLLGMSPFEAIHTTLSVYSTTGLTIVNVRMLPLAQRIIIAFMMLISALSFSFHLKILSIILGINWKMLIKRRWKEFLSSILKIKWRSVLTGETKLHILIILIFTIIYYLATHIDPFDSFMHVLSSSASVGLNIIDPKEAGEAGKVVLIIVMLIGASSFSVGGGIRVYRFYILGKTLLKAPQMFASGGEPEIKINDRLVDFSEILMNFLIIFLFVAFSAASALIFCVLGVSFSDALFESVSAISTTGSMLVDLTQAISSIHKFLLIILMLLGRIEILPAFIALSSILISEERS
ncbi:TrkH family potassium uptake protein [Candidatus Bathyarchaeota archaeon]|nr:MAG: TrkH family potassium uptake protein [Candidatus Bathyarchaeota archaeon]